jgi:hypothetical protein
VAESFLYDNSQGNDLYCCSIELDLRTLSDNETNPLTLPGALGGQDNIVRANLSHVETPLRIRNLTIVPGPLERYNLST